MATRQWRVSGSFLRVGEVAVIVQAPNWQGALRKGALEIKRSPLLKGRRLNKGIFSVNEQETVAEAITGTQETLPGTTVTATTDPVSQAMEQAVERKCSNPDCNQSFAHEGMCDNAPVEVAEAVAEEVTDAQVTTPVATETVEPPKES